MTSDPRFDIFTLVLGLIAVLFWRQVGFVASWLQERLMRPLGLRSEYTSGINLRNTRWLCLFVGIAMVGSSLISLAF